MIDADFRQQTEIDLINPMYEHNKSLLENSQTLRKEMTREERIIWYDLLKRLPFPVKRQFVIENYIVDFYIPSKKVVIEIDGSQHGREADREADRLRDAKLGEYGIRVIRYTNREINKNMNGVTTHLLKNLGVTFDELKVKG